jgi:hypothetical protein
MQHRPPIPAVFTLHATLLGDAKDTAPPAEIEKHEMSRLLLHRLVVHEAALERVAELRDDAAQAPS